MNKPFISLKILNKKGEVIKKVGTTKIKRIYHFLQAGKFKDCIFYLKVTYNYKKGYLNEGSYKKKKKLIHALRAFTEQDLIKEFK